MRQLHLLHIGQQLLFGQMQNVANGAVCRIAHAGVLTRQRKVTPGQWLAVKHLHHSIDRLFLVLLVAELELHRHVFSLLSGHSKVACRSRASCTTRCSCV